MQDAFRSGSRETLLYVPAVVPDKSRPDYLATVDADPASPTYSQVIHRLQLAAGDEPHHSGWNACSSCHADASRSRSLLILPTLGTHRVDAVDVKSDPRAPRVAKVVEGEAIKKATGLQYLHTSHCLGSGDILVSAMGDAEGGARGGFLLLGPRSPPSSDTTSGAQRRRCRRTAPHRASPALDPPATRRRPRVFTRPVPARRAPSPRAAGTSPGWA